LQASGDGPLESADAGVGADGGHENAVGKQVDDDVFCEVVLPLDVILQAALPNFPAIGSSDENHGGGGGEGGGNKIAGAAVIRGVDAPVILGGGSGVGQRVGAVGEASSIDDEVIKVRVGSDPQAIGADEAARGPIEYDGLGLVNGGLICGADDDRSEGSLGQV